MTLLRSPFGLTARLRFALSCSHLLALTICVGLQSSPLLLADDDSNSAREQILAAEAIARDVVAAQLPVLTVDDTLRYPFDTDSFEATEWRTRSATQGGWIQGFYPGLMWHFYEASGDPFWRDTADDFTRAIEGKKNAAGNHDLGFLVMLPFGNAYAMTGDPYYRDVVLTASESLSTHWMPTVGSFWSFNFNHRRGVRARQNVIVDTTMNIELLFYGAKRMNDEAVLGPDWANGALHDRAHSHIRNVVRDHVREDGSTIQIWVYNMDDGSPRRVVPWQGYGPYSTWSRGQGWAMHGLTSGYRETGDADILPALDRLHDFYVARSPQDAVAWWDFDAPHLYTDDIVERYGEDDIETDPLERDSSAASIFVSGLLELVRLTPDEQDAAQYFATAERILETLTGPEFLNVDGDHPAIVRQGTYTFPGRQKGLAWGDYYLVEALRRYSRMVEPDMQFGDDVVANSKYWAVESPREWWHMYDAGSLRFGTLGNRAAADGTERRAMYAPVAFRNFDFSVDLRSDADAERQDTHLLVYFGASPTGNSHAVEFLPGTVSVVSFDAWGDERSRTAPVASSAFETTEWESVRVQRTGASVTVYVGEVEVLSESFAGLDQLGRLGVGTKAGGFFMDDPAITGEIISTAPLPLHAWRLQNWPDDSMSFDADPAADPDDDGFSNAIEYAFATDPNQPDTSQLPHLTLLEPHDGTIRLTFPNIRDTRFQLHVYEAATGWIPGVSFENDHGETVITLPPVDADNSERLALSIQLPASKGGDTHWLELPAFVRLQTTAEGPGSLNAEASIWIERGTTVDLIATPNEGAALWGWSDAPGDFALQRSVLVEENMNITAHFAEATETFAGFLETSWPQRFNPEVIGDEADPDGDGFSNWEEYLVGTDPTAPGGVALKLSPTETADGFLDLLATARLGLADVEVVVEVSTDLVNWTVVDDAVELGDGRLRVEPNWVNGAAHYRLRLVAR